jgi:hypothetical protein
MHRRNSVPCNECVDISPLQQAEQFISVSENAREGCSDAVLVKQRDG